MRTGSSGAIEHWLRRYASRLATSRAACTPLPETIGQHQADAVRTEIEEVIIVAAHGARLNAARGEIQSLEDRRRLRQEAALYVARNLHFARRAAFGLDAGGDLFAETHVLQRDGRLAGYGRQQALVFARIRLLREARTQHQRAHLCSVAAQNNDHALGLLLRQRLAGLQVYRHKTGVQGLREMPLQQTREFGAVS